MSMITRQIEELKMQSDICKLSGAFDLGKMLLDAAETIEALSAKLAAANMEKSSQYYHGGWVPCGERLPEEPYGCLVTVMDTNPLTMEDFENLLPYFVGFDGERWNDGDGKETPFEVIAWIKLPEPYRGE